MMRCRQVAELLTSDRLRDEPLAVRVRVKLHLWMCRHCGRLARQLAELRSAARTLAHSFDRDEDLERRLLRKLTRRDG